MIEKNKFHYLFLVSLSLILVLYLLTAPSSVQYGDTGEMVSCGYMLGICHPPGYPLYTLLTYIFTHIPSSDSIFWRASLMCISFSIIVLLLLFKNSTKNLNSILFILVLATSNIYWKYSILPDVFIVLTLFVLVFLFAFERPDLLKSKWYLLLLGLSIAHHHLIIFFLPLIIYSWIKIKFDIKVALFSISAIAVGLSFYLLLPFLNSDEIYSWGNIKDVSDIIYHFLRKDYGTFTLTNITRNTSYIDRLMYFLNDFVFNFYSLFLVIIVFLKKISLRPKPMWAIIYTIVMFLLFLKLSNIDIPEATEHGLVLERFFLPFTTALVFLIIKYLPSNRLVSFFLAINIGSNIFFNFKYNNFRHNFVIEDFLKNSIKHLPLNANVFAYGDTDYFGLIYIKYVLNYRNDVRLLNYLHFTPSFSPKIQRIYPDIWENNVIDLKKHDFYIIGPEPYYALAGNSDLRFSELGLYSKLEKSNNTHFNCREYSDFYFRIKFNKKLDYFDPFLKFYSRYHRCFFLEGSLLLHNKKYNEAKIVFEKILAFDSNFVPAKFKLCEIFKMINKSNYIICQRELDLLLKENYVHNYIHGWVTAM
jgi:hypothetical protein